MLKTSWNSQYMIRKQSDWKCLWHSCEAYFVRSPKGLIIFMRLGQIFVEKKTLHWMLSMGKISRGTRKEFSRQKCMSIPCARGFWEEWNLTCSCSEYVYKWVSSDVERRKSTRTQTSSQFAGWCPYFMPITLKKTLFTIIRRCVHYLEVQDCELGTKQ